MNRVRTGTAVLSICIATAASPLAFACIGAHGAPKPTPPGDAPPARMEPDSPFDAVPLVVLYQVEGGSPSRSRRLTFAAWGSGKVVYQFVGPTGRLRTYQRDVPVSRIESLLKELRAAGFFEVQPRQSAAVSANLWTLMVRSGQTHETLELTKAPWQRDLDPWNDRDIGDVFALCEGQLEQLAEGGTEVSAEAAQQLTERARRLRIEGRWE